MPDPPSGTAARHQMEKGRANDPLPLLIEKPHRKHHPPGKWKYLFLYLDMTCRTGTTILRKLSPATIPSSPFSIRKGRPSLPGKEAKSRKSRARPNRGSKAGRRTGRRIYANGKAAPALVEGRKRNPGQAEKQNLTEHIEPNGLHAQSARSFFRVNRKAFSIHPGKGLFALNRFKFKKMPHFFITGTRKVSTYSMSVPEGSSL